MSFHTERDWRRIYEAVAEHGAFMAAARALKINRESASKGYHKAIAPASEGGLGLPELELAKPGQRAGCADLEARKRARLGEIGVDVLPGYEVAGITTRYDGNGRVTTRSVTQGRERGNAFAIPDGKQFKAGTYHVGGDGRVIQNWPKVGPAERDPLEVAEALASRFEQMQYAIPTIPAPEEYASEFLNFIPLADLHLGLRAFCKEVDGENWDLRIADKAYRKALARLIGRLPAAETCVILGGGDLLHANDNTNLTPASKHALDVDGRHDHVIEVAQDLVLDVVTLALQRHQHVIVKLLKGNHDPDATIAVSGFLRGAFRRNERVDVLTCENEFWMHQHGLVMLVANHGHKVKMSKLPGIMAGRYPEVWGATKYRYGHSFHIHHETLHKDEASGAIIETHSSPAAQDVYSYTSGFISSRVFTATTYSAAYGRVGTLTEPVS